MRKIPLLLCLLAAAFVTLAAQSLFSLSVTVQGDGEVVKYLDGEETEETQFYYGTTIELEAIPAEGSFFVQWDDGSNTSFFKTIDIEADITTCSAEFHKMDTVKTGVNTVLATYASYQYERAKGGAKDEEDEEEDDLDDDDVDPEEPDDPEELDDPEGGFEGTPNPNCVFIPTEDGTYTFYTVGDADTYGVLFNSDMEVLKFDDDKGENYNFNFSYLLKADETYYISAGFLDGDIVDDIELHIVHIDIEGPSTITVSAEGKGNVGILLNGVSTVETTFDYGTELVLTAKPNPGNFFVQWNEESTDLEYEITVERDSNYVGKFHEIQTVVKGENTVLATYGKSYSQKDSRVKGGAKDDDDDDDDDDDWDDDDPDNEELEFEGTPNPNCVFNPEVSGIYTFYTECEYPIDTYGMLFDSELNYLADDDDYEEDNYNFKFSHYLEAGKIYYITAGFLNADTVAEISLYIEAVSVTASITGNGEVEVYEVEEGEDDEVYVDLIATLNKSNSAECFVPDTELGLRAKPANNNFFVQWGDGSKGFDKTLVAENDTTLAVEFHEIQKVVEGENIVYATYGRSYEPEEDEPGTPNPNCVFVPEVSATYVIFTESNKDTYGVLFASDSTMLTWNDDPDGAEIGEEQPGEPEIDPIHISPRNFRFSYDFEEGETYYISAGFYYDTTLASYTKLQIKAPVTIAVSADATKGSASISYLADGEIIEGENGEVTVTYGDTVTVSAEANENYEFLRWSDGSTEEEHTFEALESTTLVAYFKPVGAVVYTINATSNDNAMGTVTGGSVYLATDEVKLEAIPANHHHFVKWSDETTANPYIFTPDRDSTLEAEFAIDTVKLTVLAQNGIPSVSKPTYYDWGQVVTISASANEHYHFVKWSDGVTSESRAIKVKSDTTVTAIYEIDTFVVDVESENGTVNGAEDGEYAYNSNLTLEAVADEHYHFIKWNDNTVTNPREVNIKCDTSFYAVFAIDTFNVTMAETVENGTIDGLGEFIYGTEASFEAKADQGFKFVRWTGWTASDNTENPLEFTVEEDVVLSPLFIDENKDLFLVTVNATEGGTVTGAGEYLTGDKAKLTATPNEGYRFFRWSDVNNTQSPREITVTSDTVITAQFRPKTFEIVVNAGAHGKVTGGEFYAYNSKATITAIPDKGYHFVKWKETGSTEAEFSITVKEEQTFTAEFAIDNYAIAATAVANGTVAGAGNYDYGTEVTLTATPAAGYHFVKWSNDATANPYKFAAESNLTLTAEFAINTYEVTVSAANGTVTGAGTYNHGAEATLTATAAEGYSFVKWSDGVTEASRKVTVTSNLAFTAEFAINSYDVTATATNGVVEGTGKYNYGAEATLNAVANKGYHFVKWSDDVTTATRKETVKGNLSFTAVFAANTYTVTVNAEANGTVSGAGTYEYGATATLEATANDGYRFDKWSDGVKTAKRTIEVVGDTTLTASFAVRTYEITAEAQNGKVEGVGTYNRGDEVELTAKPNVGYHFVCWSDSVIENPRKVIVNNDTTVTALFEKEAITISVNGKFGKITGSTGKLEFGATVTLTAVPDSGYHFVMWSDSVLDNPRTVTLTAELLTQVQESGFEFSAIFEKDDEPGVAVADEAAEAVKIFAFGNTIAVENADSDIFVFNAMGRLISRTAPEAGRTEIKVNGTGIYVVKTGNAAKRVMIND